MSDATGFNLHGFDLPIHELSPGFLVPIFTDRYNGFVLHHFNEQRKVARAIPVIPTDMYLMLSTLRATGQPSVTLLSNLAVQMGDAAHRAFFDGAAIVWGEGALVREWLTSAVGDLRSKLCDHPFVMAQVCDFVGQSDEACQLRENAANVLEQTPTAEQHLKGSALQAVRTVKSWPPMRLRVESIENGKASFIALLNTSSPNFSQQRLAA